MDGEGGLRPVLNDAACGDWDELLGAVVDQANDLCAGVFVEAARGKQLRDLFAELGVSF